MAKKHDQSFYIKRNMLIALAIKVGHMHVDDVASILNVSRALIYKVLDKQNINKQS